MPHEKRIKELRKKAEERGFEAILVNNEKNIHYLTNFPWGGKLLILTEGDGILFVRSVNYEAAKNFAKNVIVELVRDDEKIEEKIFDTISGRGLKSIGFDKMDAIEYQKMRESLKGVRIECIDDIIWSLRRIKDEDEIALIRRAAELTSRGMERALETIKPGVKEWEVASEAEYEMRRCGSSGIAFDTIICSGPETVYPHGGLGEREIRDGDFVVVDIGAKYRGYCADMTRTIIVGEGTRVQKHMLETVRETQRLAIGSIRNGVIAREVDGIARKFIMENGYGKYFVHNLGHGIGLDVHEPPTLGPLSEDVLLARNTVTIEPGIYIPGIGGARVEDTILVSMEGAIKLTGLSEKEKLL